MHKIWSTVSPSHAFTIPKSLLQCIHFKMVRIFVFQILQFASNFCNFHKKCMKFDLQFLSVTLLLFPKACCDVKILRNFEFQILRVLITFVIFIKNL